MRRLPLCVALAIICAGSVLAQDVYTDDLVYQLYYHAFVHTWVAVRLHDALETLSVDGDMNAYVDTIQELAQTMVDIGNQVRSYIQTISLALHIPADSLQERLAQEIGALNE